MALDPSISLGVRGPDIQIQSPMQAIGQALTLRDMMARGQMQQMQMQEQQLQLDQARRVAQEKQDFANYLQSKMAPQTPTGGTPGQQPPTIGAMPDLDRAEIARRFPNVAPGFLKGMHDVNVAQLDEQIKRDTLTKNHIERISSAIGSAVDEPTKIVGLTKLFNAGDITQAELDRYRQLPYDSPVIKQLGDMALTHKDQLQAGLDAAEEARKNEIQAHNRVMYPSQEAEAVAKAGTAQAEQQTKQMLADANVLAPAFARSPQEGAAALAKLSEARQAPFLGVTSADDIRRRALTPEQYITTAEQQRHNLFQEQQERERTGITRQEQALRQRQFDATYGALIGPDGKSLDPQAAQAVASQDPTAVAIANYQLAPPSMARGGQAASIMRKVMAINPTYRADQWEARKQTELEYSPRGKTGQGITSTDTALAHVGNISDAGKALKNGDLQKLNEIANAIGAQTGSSPRIVYDAIVSMVAPEVSKAVIGGVGGEAERQTMAHNFSSNVNDKTREDTIAGVVKLLGERYQKVAHAYEAQMDRSLPPNRLSDASKAMLQRYGVSAEKPVPAGTTTGQRKSLGEIFR